MTVNALKQLYNQLPERAQNGLAAGGYTLIAFGAAASTFAAYSSERCHLHFYDSSVVPYCNGGLQPTVYFNGILPLVFLGSAIKAKECFLKCIL